MTKYLEGPRIPGAGAFAREMHRKARLPRWGGRHGDRARGSVSFAADESGSAWVVTFSFLIGYEATMRVSERYQTWGLAMSEYREHDRTVRERQALEKFRSGGRTHGLAAQTYS